MNFSEARRRRLTLAAKTLGTGKPRSSLGKLLGKRMLACMIHLPVATEYGALLPVEAVDLFHVAVATPEATRFALLLPLFPFLTVLFIAFLGARHTLLFEPCAAVARSSRPRACTRDLL